MKAMALARKLREMEIGTQSSRKWISSKRQDKPSQNDNLSMEWKMTFCAKMQGQSSKNARKSESILKKSAVKPGAGNEVYY
ncbi:hypothetical protein Tco_0046183 [Tanacetum coccineum]